MNYRDTGPNTSAKRASSSQDGRGQVELKTGDLPESYGNSVFFSKRVKQTPPAAGSVPSTAGLPSEGVLAPGEGSHYFLDATAVTHYMNVEMGDVIPVPPRDLHDHDPSVNGLGPGQAEGSDEWAAMLTTDSSTVVFLNTYLREGKQEPTYHNNGSGAAAAGVADIAISSNTSFARFEPEYAAGQEEQVPSAPDAMAAVPGLEPATSGVAQPHSGGSTISTAALLSPPEPTAADAPSVPTEGPRFSVLRAPAASPQLPPPHPPQQPPLRSFSPGKYVAALQNRVTTGSDTAFQALQQAHGGATDLLARMRPAPLDLDSLTAAVRQHAAAVVAASSAAAGAASLEPVRQRAGSVTPQRARPRQSPAPVECGRASAAAGTPTRTGAAAAAAAVAGSGVTFTQVRDGSLTPGTVSRYRVPLDSPGRPVISSPYVSVQQQQQQQQQEQQQNALQLLMSLPQQPQPQQHMFLSGSSHSDTLSSPALSTPGVPTVSPVGQSLEMLSDRGRSVHVPLRSSPAFDAKRQQLERDKQTIRMYEDRLMKAKQNLQRKEQALAAELHPPAQQELREIHRLTASCQSELQQMVQWHQRLDGLAGGALPREPLPSMSPTEPDLSEAHLSAIGAPASAIDTGAYPSALGIIPESYPRVPVPSPDRSIPSRPPSAVYSPPLPPPRHGAPAQGSLHGSTPQQSPSTFSQSSVLFMGDGRSSTGTNEVTPAQSALTTQVLQHHLLAQQVTPVRTLTGAPLYPTRTGAMTAPSTPQASPMDRQMRNWATASQPAQSPRYTPTMGFMSLPQPLPPPPASLHALTTLPAQEPPYTPEPQHRQQQLQQQQYHQVPMQPRKLFGSLTEQSALAEASSHLPPLGPAPAAQGVRRDVPVGLVHANTAPVPLVPVGTPAAYGAAPQAAMYGTQQGPAPAVSPATSFNGGRPRGQRQDAVYDWMHVHRPYNKTRGQAQSQSQSQSGSQSQGQGRGHGPGKR